MFLPVGIMCFFGESFTVAWNANILRCILVLHVVFCINSAAHIWDAKPYDKDISPTNTYWVSFFNFGEGWHNYHHVRFLSVFHENILICEKTLQVFPWDYKTAELPLYFFNFSCMVIDFMAWIGWATELKTV